MLKRLLGDYVPARDSIINNPHLQYNYLHTWFGEIEDFGGHDTSYFSYSDAGLLGHYAMSLDLSGFYTPVAVLKSTRLYTCRIFESELYRARNKYYN